MLETKETLLAAGYMKKIVKEDGVTLGTVDEDLGSSHLRGVWRI